MMTIKTFYMSLMVMFLFPTVICRMVLVFGNDTRFQAIHADPVEAVISAYNESDIEFYKRDNPSPDAIRAHQQEWRNRLEKVKAEHPRSKFIEEAQTELLQLYNSLNELDKSQAVVQEFIDAADTPEMKYLWYHELGTICQKKHQDTHEESDLQKSQEAFGRAKDLFLTFSPETQNQLNHTLSPEKQSDIPKQLDPIQMVLEKYREAADNVRENLSPATALAHMQEWRDRFEEVIAANPKSEFVNGAKIKLVGLYNGLNELDKSQTLLRKMISDKNMPKENILFLNQLGTISRMRFADSQNKNDLKESLEAFERADELFRSLPPEQQRGNTGGMQIVNLCTAAMTAKEANNHEKSATLFRSARELFQSSSESAAYATSVNYDLEAITNLEMEQWIRLKRESEALKCLEILSHLPSFRWCPSYYALKYATQWYGKDSKSFQSFVLKWLHDNPLDDRTPILMAHLGFSYYRDGLYDKARPIYETLRDKYRADFQKLEPKAFEEGNGGYYEQILYDLSKIYMRQGIIVRRKT